jgi:chemotaxis protein methyltransferase CheR
VIDEAAGPDEVDLAIDSLLEAIYVRFQHDFRRYARASVRRRLMRALQHFQLPTIAALTEHILHDEAAFGQLMAFLTIGVSDMFRDPAFFLAVRSAVVPVLATYPSLKLWVAGCATGEEVYSLAIVLAEEGLLDRTLLYATDINLRSLETAERGIYDVARAPGFSRAYQAAGGRRSLSDYYMAAYGAITLSRELRKRIVLRSQPRHRQRLLRGPHGDVPQRAHVFRPSAAGPRGRAVHRRARPQGLPRPRLA